jgi:hypothetical protein
MFEKIKQKAISITGIIIGFIKKQDKKTITIASIIIVIISAALLAYIKTGPGFSGLKFWTLGDKKIAEKAIKYINNNNLASSEASLVSYSRESGLIKIKIKIGATEFDSYLTKDGKYLFPQVIEMKETETENTEETTPTVSVESCEDMTKTDNPMLEAYVVSMCPYGLQMQRAMADAVIKVPELASYIKVRYIGSVSENTITSMHGEDEATENFRQICIREEQPSKYWNYVSCQIKAGDSKGCETQTGIDSSKLSACMADTNRGVAYAKEDFNLNSQYGVTGSPTLMMADSRIYESSFGGRSSDAIKEIVCCASTTEPGFCSQTLNTSSAASSYSENYSGSGATTSASCE